MEFPLSFPLSGNVLLYHCLGTVTFGKYGLSGQTAIGLILSLGLVLYLIKGGSQLLKKLPISGIILPEPLPAQTTKAGSTSHLISEELGPPYAHVLKGNPLLAHSGLPGGAV